MKRYQELEACLPLEVFRYLPSLSKLVASMIGAQIACCLYLAYVVFSVQ